MANCAPATASSSEPLTNETLPRTCNNCYLSYKDFSCYYSGHYDRLIQLCQDHGLLKKQAFCPHCGKECRLDLLKKGFRCDRSYAPYRKKAKKRCDYYLNIFKGTWFSRTRLDVETALFFVYLYVSDFFSYRVARTELALSDMAINDWSSFAREVIVHWCIRHKKQIGGPGTTVEIDEAKFGKRKYNVDRVSEGQWMFCGFCRQTGQFFVVPVTDTTSKTLLAVIMEYIVPGTTVVSDCWRAYDCLGDEGYVHLTVSRAINFVDPVIDAHSNAIARRWSKLRETTARCGRRRYNFVGYLSVAYFKLHFQDPKTRFHAFIKAAADLYPPPL
ncbi:uncharacterized protein LOC135223491 [Macrobrachium nipponense]|uniref:uncharacterized protein LOC135223491 n=1 Tax=Macrobrachium nipponense TaxID=159736 RepID=UPI0030C80EED